MSAKPTAHKPRSVSVLVTTFNWPEALAKTLRALAAQQALPSEVIVADDGSGPATRACIERIARGYPMPLHHCWQPDQGFRAALCRNRAIAAASSEYVILLDGDMVPHPSFVADHLTAARRNTFVQGMRVLTDADGRDRLLASEDHALGFFDPGIRRRRHALRLPWLSRCIAAVSPSTSLKAIKTCNQAWWREDLVALNGFDERYQGWGREDVDLAVRAVRAGIKRRSLRFAGLASHLYHPERHDGETSPNDALIFETKHGQRTRSLLGLDRHLEMADQSSTPNLAMPAIGEHAVAA
jgi:GT2 family glycosyltransferase